MNVTTIQHKNVLNNLISDGKHYVENDKFLIVDNSDDAFFTECLLDLYKYMISKMINLENKYNAEYPIWVYVDNEAFNNSGMEEFLGFDEVKINLDIPEEFILLSNHTYFENYLMNYQAIAVDNKEYIYYNKCSLKEKMTTWDRIFMKEPEKNWKIMDPKDCVWQGCLWFLKKEWIID